MSAKKEKNNAESKYTLEQRTICENNVVLYIRNDSDARWHARIRQKAGTWHRFSTKQTSLDKAKASARERYLQLQDNIKNKRVLVERKFSDVCKVVKKELQAEYKKTHEHTLKTHIEVINNYLIPFLGDYKCHEITNAVLKDFSKARENKLGRQPTVSTIANHNSALNYVLRQAQSLGYMTTIPKLKNDGSASGTRDWFNEDEYRALVSFMRKDLNDAKKKIGKDGRNGIDTITTLTYEIKELLRDTVLILANTGIRAGKEIVNLKWSNLDIIEADGKEMLQFSLTHTKTMKKTGKRRKVIAYQSRDTQSQKKTYGVFEPLSRIASRFDDTKDLDWNDLFEKDIDIFRLPSTKEVVSYDRLGKSFVALLKRCPYKGRKEGLYRASNGNSRSLYSLRHTYATMRLKDGMTMEDLSRNLGASIKMIEDHYGHLTPEMVPLRYSEKITKKQVSELELLKEELREMKQENKELRAELRELIKTLNHKSR
jgi:integrase